MERLCWKLIRLTAAVCTVHRAVGLGINDLPYYAEYIRYDVYPRTYLYTVLLGQHYSKALFIRLMCILAYYEESYFEKGAKIKNRMKVIEKLLECS